MMQNPKMQSLKISSEPQASAQDRDVIRAGIDLFNVAVTRNAYYSPLNIFLRDERGAVLGGALGDVWGGWLELKFLWVAEPVRGAGYGERLLKPQRTRLGLRGAGALS